MTIMMTDTDNLIQEARNRAPLLAAGDLGQILTNLAGALEQERAMRLEAEHRQKVLEGAYEQALHTASSIEADLRTAKAARAKAEAEMLRGAALDVYALSEQMHARADMIEEGK